MPLHLDPVVVHAVTHAYHGAPFDVLGSHPLTTREEPGRVVRTFQPQAKAVAVQRGADATSMTRVQNDGFFEATFPTEAEAFAYQLVITLPDDTTYTIDDPYRFGPVLTDYDLHLFVEGTHYQLYDKLGAHVVTHEGVTGVNFSVWAPNAERVSVMGSFNQWEGRRHPMRQRGQTGVWEIFIPGLQVGDVYKYEIKTRYMGMLTVKTDPFGFYGEVRPSNASVVWDIHRYTWNDGDWMSHRKQRQNLETPISIYEVHLGSWKRRKEGGEEEDEAGRWLTYRELADELITYVKDMGYTHIELMPITEHPYDGSWGYQVTGYFAPTARFGTPDDFRYFVDRAHQAGIGIIIDWVPAHFPKDGHGLGFFDGTYLYEHADPRRGFHPDWGTLIFNLSRREVTAFLLSSAIFWLQEYHIDGMRVDAVASMLYLDYSRKPGEWVPNEYGGRENLESVHFLKQFNDLVHKRFPDVLTFAEESTAWPLVSRPTYVGGLGFDLKWNMGWMHDSLKYMGMDSIFRHFHHNSLTFSLYYAFTENFILPLSHDEVVHGKRSLLSKMPGDYWRQFANLRALYTYMYAHPGKKLNFMGGEFGQWTEWGEAKQLDWTLLDFEAHRKLQTLVRDLNHIYQAEPSLYQVDFTWEGFQWIDFHDVVNSVVSFVRKAKDQTDFLVVVANFTPVVRKGYRVGVPTPGLYKEILTSDADTYGGSNIRHSEGVNADPTPWQGMPHSILITLPPLAVMYFKTDYREPVVVVEKKAEGDEKKAEEAKPTGS